MAKANICCSIELEPKTLNHGQLYQAREVAADVVQKLEPDEASAVFNDVVERFKTVNQAIEKRELPQPSQDYEAGGKRKMSMLLPSY